LKLIFSKAEFVAKVCDLYAYFGIVYLLNGLEQFDATVCLIRKTKNSYETKLFDDADSDFDECETTEIDALQISATEIRDRLHQGIDVSAMVPAAVLSYIGSKGLYGSA
jgi:nicotinic acid mononucleotide adenylyltransferase